MRKIITIVLIITTTSNFFSQKNPSKNWPQEEGKQLKIIDASMESGSYKTAYANLSELLVKHPNETYLKYKLGICGLHLTEHQGEALKYLNDVYEVDKKATDIEYYLAELCHKNYQFDKALELSSKLLANKNTRPNVKSNIEELRKNCEAGKILFQNPNQVKIENLGSPLNTDAAEYSPVLTSDEESMYYTYRGKSAMRDSADKEYSEDIFTSKKIDGKWQQPESVSELNTIDNEAAIALSNDGHQLFLYKATETDNGDIYSSEVSNGKFSSPVRLKGDVNTNSWEGSISQSSDARKIIFASERSGGFGGKDLYVAYLMPDNSWGQAKNLGSTINTSKDEDAPFIHPDGRSLVFSSEGHNSMGGFDIFVSDLDQIDSSWKSPVNLGYPVNSTNDDLFYSISADGKKGYYSATKQDAFGDQDIYVVEPAIAAKKNSLTVIKGKMTEDLFPFEGGEIQVTLLSDNRKFGTFKPNSNSGHYLINLPSGYDYSLNFYHPVLGDKTFKVKTNTNSDFTEKFINVNYGMADTSSTNEFTLDFRTPFASQTPNFTATGNNADEGTTSMEDVKKIPHKTMDAKILAKYGKLKANGLKYRVQLAAYRFPQNYKSEHLKAICNVIQHGKLNGNIVLIVADKEFDSINEACDFLSKIQAAGQTDAFVTAEYNGKRYYINDIPALEISSKLFLAVNN